jgi:imidazolonepropionase-like amidohydrolase
LTGAYTGKAIKRVVELGVRTIEHGNFVDDEAAASMAKYGAFAVPTLVTYDAMSRVGAQMGLSADVLTKNEAVRLQGHKALEIFKRHGVKMGLGSDLLGDMQQFQSDELSIRAEILGTFEVICQATAVGAEIVGKKDELGIVKAGAFCRPARGGWRSSGRYPCSRRSGRTHRWRPEGGRMGQPHRRLMIRGR